MGPSSPHLWNGAADFTNSATGVAFRTDQPYQHAQPVVRLTEEPLCHTFRMRVICTFCMVASSVSDFWES